MIGPILGRKRVVVPVASLALQSDAAGEESGGERDAEEDQHGARDLPDADLEALRVQAEPAGQDGQVEVAEQRERGDLEERVEDDEHRRAVAVALGEVVPDQHHRDAAREADDDHAGAIGGMVGEEEPGQREHEQRPDHPREEQRHAEEAPVGDAVGLRATELLVVDLRQHRVHHQQQAQRDRQADRADPQLVEAVVETGDQPAEPEPDRHGERDPERQEAVERRQLPRAPPRRPALEGVWTGGRSWTTAISAILSSQTAASRSDSASFSELRAGMRPAISTWSSTTSAGVLITPYAAISA